MTAASETTVLNADQLRDILPQAWPFIMLDRVIHFEKGKSLTAVKNVTATEWFFRGQEDSDVQTIPPMLLVEAAAQAGLVLLKCSSNALNGLTFFLSKFSVSFKQPVDTGVYFFKATVGKCMTDKGYFDVEITDNRQFHSQVNFFYFLKTNV